MNGIAKSAYPIFGNAFSTEFVLIFGESDTSSIASKILCSIGDESSPTATNIKNPIKVKFSSEKAFD